MHSVKSLKNRKNLIQNLPITITLWIGLNDIESENKWVCVNEEPANSFEVFWNRSTGEPNNVNNEDCSFVTVDRSRDPVAYDNRCTSGLPGLCEKKLS